MKTLNVALLVSVILVAGVFVLPLSISSVANADTLCKFTKDNQRCDLDIARVNGPFKLSIVNEQNNNGGGTGGGNVSTVDQQARNDIASNSAADAQTVVRVDGVAGNVTALQGLVASQANEIQQLKADLQTLNASVITGISLSNGTVPNPPVPVVCEPPAILNSTTNQCETPIVVEPPTNDTGNGTGNGTGNSTGNLTG